jgi:hypothetical protein
MIRIDMTAVQAPKRGWQDLQQGDSRRNHWLFELEHALLAMGSRYVCDGGSNAQASFAAEVAGTDGRTVRPSARPVLLLRAKRTQGRCCKGMSGCSGHAAHSGYWWLILRKPRGR